LQSWGILKKITEDRCPLLFFTRYQVILYIFAKKTSNRIAPQRNVFIGIKEVVSESKRNFMYDF